MKKNFKFQHSGSFVQIFALTDKATNWLSENLSLESWQWIGNSVAIDKRYFDDIYAAMQYDF